MVNKNSVVINVLGAPGAGKSTISAGLFYLMKINHFSVDFAWEYAKDAVYEERFNLLGAQDYIFAKQHRRIARLTDKVDYVITDSSLLFSIIYSPDTYPTSFNQYVLDTFETFNNYNIFIKRNKNVEFQTEGRVHDETQSDELSDEIIELLDSCKIPYTVVEASPVAHQQVYDILKRDNILPHN